MSWFVYLIPIALVMGLTGLMAFMWALRNGQYDDLEGAAARILTENDAPPGNVAPPEGKAPGVDA